MLHTLAHVLIVKIYTWDLKILTHEENKMLQVFM